MRMWKPLVVVIPALILVSGCGSSVGSVAKTDVEKNLAAQYATDNAMAPEDISVTCAGDLAGTVGATVECDVSLDQGTVGRVEVKVTDVNGDTINYDVTEIG